MKIHVVILTVLVTLAILVTGCSESGSILTSGPTGTISSTAVQPAKTGTVQMWVTDAPRTDNISEIWVTVTDVKIHEAAAAQVSGDVSGETDGEIDDTADSNGWISINMTGPNRFDLLTLRGESGGLQQILATENLTVGLYTQIRMTVPKVEVNIGGVLKVADIPSGKLKFIHPFSVQADSITKLLFDFDADKFVVVSGSPKNPKIMAKPVVKLIVSAPKPAGGSGGGVKITTPSLPNGAVGESYDATLSATGGTLPYNWIVLSGNLTEGLTLSPVGVISGTPVAGEAGDHVFTVKVSDNSTPVKSDTRQYQITIAEEGELIITTTYLADGKAGVAYSATLNAIGGTPPYSWSINGTAPDGLTLGPDTGVISWTPTKNGNYDLTAQVSDNATPANIDTQELSIRVFNK